MKDSMKKKQMFIRISTFAAYVIVLLLMFQTRDFIGAIFAKDDSYEIRYEEPIGVTNQQKIYMLYKNGQYVEDADLNRLCLLDDQGNTDIRYCVLIKEARRLSYSIILGAMMLVVILIANSASNGTPFTHKNAMRIRIIGGLQFALAVVPGLVAFLMNFFRFQYANLSLTLNGFYMFIIGFAIMVLAQVFDYGVKLQEYMDSIA